MRRPQLVALALSALTVTAHVGATEPLIDGLIYGDAKGYVLPTRCCWLELPASDALTKLRQSENCTAIGGPVGQYEYRNRELYLLELRRCSGVVQLHEVFPNLPRPALATWLSGNYVGLLNRLCTDKGGRAVFETEVEMTVVQGVVTQQSEKRNARTQCE